MKDQAKFSCRLTTPELQKRKVTVLAELKALMDQREDLADGFRYTFAESDSTIEKLATFIRTERLCCDFFTFRLIVGEQTGKVFLELTGPAGVREFIEEEIGF